MSDETRDEVMETLRADAAAVDDERQVVLRQAVRRMAANVAVVEERGHVSQTLEHHLTGLRDRVLAFVEGIPAGRRLGALQNILKASVTWDDERGRACWSLWVGDWSAEIGVLGGEPIPMVLHCPVCGAQHIDAPEPENGWENPPHRSHQCHTCGTRWRPAGVPSVGVARLAAVGSSDTWVPPGEDVGAGETLPALFHKLWTAAAGKPGYDKKEWQRLRQMLYERGVQI